MDVGGYKYRVEGGSFCPPRGRYSESPSDQRQHWTVTQPGDGELTDPWEGQINYKPVSVGKQMERNGKKFVSKTLDPVESLKMDGQVGRTVHEV